MDFDGLRDVERNARVAHGVVCEFLVVGFPMEVSFRPKSRRRGLCLTFFHAVHE